jgi:hypothetical protein
MKCGWARVFGPHYPHKYRKWGISRQCPGCQHPWGMMENDLGLVLLKCPTCGATRRVLAAEAQVLGVRSGGSLEPSHYEQPEGDKGNGSHGGSVA